jgi:hypothetical protein
VIRVETSEFFYTEWCDCRTPEFVFDSGGCHAVIVKLGSLSLSRSCRGLCDSKDCQLEDGAHKYKRCLCK